MPDAIVAAMDELEFMRGRVYGADHDAAAPKSGRVYVELVGGPLDGLLLDVTGRRPAQEACAGVALPTEIGRHGPGGRSLYAPRAADERRFDWRGDIP